MFELNHSYMMKLYTKLCIICGTIFPHEFINEEKEAYHIDCVKCPRCGEEESIGLIKYGESKVFEFKCTSCELDWRYTRQPVTNNHEA